MSKRKRSKQNGKTQPEKPASPSPLPEVVEPPAPEAIEEIHPVDTTAEVDEAQVALDALTAQLAELETLSQETEAQVASLGSDYQSSLANYEANAGTATLPDADGEDNAVQRVGDAIADVAASRHGRLLLVGGLGLFAVALMVGLIIFGKPPAASSSVNPPLATAGMVPSAKIPEPDAAPLPLLPMDESVDMKGISVDIEAWQVGTLEGAANALMPGGLVIVDLALSNQSQEDIAIQTLLEGTDLIDEQNRILTHLVRQDARFFKPQGTSLAAGQTQTLRLVFRSLPGSSGYRMEFRGDKPCRIPLTRMLQKASSKKVA